MAIDALVAVTVSLDMFVMGHILILVGTVVAAEVSLKMFNGPLTTVDSNGGTEVSTELFAIGPCLFTVDEVVTAAVSLDVSTLEAIVTNTTTKTARMKISWIRRVE